MFMPHPAMQREGILRPHASLRRIYILQQFKVQQEKYDNEEMKLGHEMLSVYKQYAWEFAPLRCSWLGADCLGPVGDEKRGVHVKWLVYCHQNIIKSTAEHYQDNRFNAMLQDAAEIHHHRAEISDFGQKLETSNLKVHSGVTDPTDPTVWSMVHALAVAYMEVTRPC